MIYTFDGIKTEIKSRLSLLNNWQDTLFYSVYDRIIDVLAYTAMLIIYVAEFFYKESKLQTAENINSVRTLVRWLGYTPYRKKGATGILKMCWNSSFASTAYTGEQIIIPKWTRFSDADNKLFVYSTEFKTYDTGTVGSINIPVTEGTPKQFLYIAEGVKNEKIYLYSDSIENDNIEIQIVDDQYNILAQVNIVKNLYLLNTLLSYNCQIDNADNEQYITIAFGDGINVRKLSAGERVLIKYADTLAENGNITTLNKIVVIKDIIYDSTGTIASMYVRNEEAISGGSAAEDIDSIKNNSTNLFQVGSLLGGYDNWVSVINSVPYVNKSIVWTNEQLNTTIYDASQNIVYYTAVSTTGDDLTDAQKADVEVNYLLDLKCLTETVEWKALQKIYLGFDIDAKYPPQNKTIPVIKQDVKTALSNAYGITNIDFQTSVNESNFYGIINATDNVIYHTSNIWHIEDGISTTMPRTAIKVSYPAALTTVLENQIYLLRNNFEIWVKLKVSGSWKDSNGDVRFYRIGYTNTSSEPAPLLADSSSVSIPISGWVYYSTNEYAITSIDMTGHGVANPSEATANGYILYIRYKTRDGNNEQTNSVRLPQKQFITDVEEDLIRIEAGTLLV